MIQLGQMNHLKVARQVDFGYYLNAGEMGDVLLPAKEAPEGVRIGQEIDVFLYLDQEERLVATTIRPRAMVGEFACLNVAWTNNFGAFLDWGLMKDLFVPFREQKAKMQRGESHIVHIHLDTESHRIVASARIEHYLCHDMPPYHSGDEVNLMVWHRTPLGYKVIIDGRYAGLIYHDQVFTTLHTGQRLKGYVLRVREDGKTDCALQPTGRSHVEDFSSTLLQRLKTEGGCIALGDKSPAEQIYLNFGVSKKVFKQAVGALYKQRLICVEPERIVLTND